MNDFEFRIPGKWILSGEHAVLRGTEALVFPLNSKYLYFKYQQAKTFENTEFTLSMKGENSSDLELIIWSVFEKALNEIQIKRHQLSGHLNITSCIAFGAGMGASATLAVGLSEFLKKLDLLKSDTFLFAKKIEDLFHGESSGVDVAVALYQKPLLYQRHSPIQFLGSVNLPKLYLSHCGVRGVTKDCVEKVKKLFLTHPQLAAEVDLKMSESVSMFKKILNSCDLVAWIKAIKLAQSCFELWGLVPVEAQKHIDDLKRNGALACKMTGSGGGGYVLSLWDEAPPIHLESILIKV